METTSWTDTLLVAWKSASSFLVRVESMDDNDANDGTNDDDPASMQPPPPPSSSSPSPLPHRHDGCHHHYNVVDTTPPSDLQQFQQAVQVMIGDNGSGSGSGTSCSRMQPPWPFQWQKTTCVTEIPYCRQLDTWDCGVACLQMIMAWLRNDDQQHVGSINNSNDDERQYMLDTLGTRSIWTIDLLMLLHTMCSNDSSKRLQPHGQDDDDEQLSSSSTSIGCSYLLCSKTLGVNRHHNRLRYYEKAFDKDSIRVNRLFDEAAHDDGLNLLCLSHLGLTQVIRLVSHPDIVALCLLDNTSLRRAATTTTTTAATTTSWSSLFRRHFSTSTTTTTTTTSSYAGHYVILCGMSYDPVHVTVAKQSSDDRSSSPDDVDYCMVMKNPGSGNDTDYVTPYLFEKAWRAEGTDDDVIFIMKK